MTEPDDKLKWLRLAIEDLATDDDPAPVAARIDEGGDVNGRDEYEQTPLMWACETGNAAAVRLLLDREADVDAIDEDGKSVLMYGVEAGRRDLLAVLVARGADGGVTDNEGRTALHYAADTWATDFDDRTEEAEFFELLLGSGVDINAVNEDDETALALAEEQDRLYLVEILKKCGATG